MGLKNFIRHELLIEGGKALKATSGIKQKHVKALLDKLIPKIARELGLKRSQVLPIGSAGRKPNLDDLSGDIDIAVQTADIDAVRKAIERLCVGGFHRSMPAINVYSFAAEHPEGTVQVDLMPVPDLKLAAWAFYSADSDMKQGLKGSHRNEVLFALAKHCAMQVFPVGDVPDGERRRYKLDLNTGLYKVKQSRIGKKDKPVKSWTTHEKELIATDPDEICRILFGYEVPSAGLLSFEDALKALNDKRFGYSVKRADVLAAAKEGMARKELVLPPSLTEALKRDSGKQSIDDKQEVVTAKGLKVTLKLKHRFTPASDDDGEFMGGEVQALIGAREVGRLPYGYGSEPVLQVGDMVVSAAYRRKGIARAMFQFVREHNIPLKHYPNEHDMSAAGRAFSKAVRDD